MLQVWGQGGRGGNRGTIMYLIIKCLVTLYGDLVSIIISMEILSGVEVEGTGRGEGMACTSHGGINDRYFQWGKEL